MPSSSPQSSPRLSVAGSDKSPDRSTRRGTSSRRSASAPSPGSSSKWAGKVKSDRRRGRPASSAGRSSPSSGRGTSRSSRKGKKKVAEEVLGGKRVVVRGGEGGLSANEARLLHKTWKPPMASELRAIIYRKGRLSIEEFKMNKIIGSGTFSYVRLVYLRHTDDKPHPMALKTMKKKLLLDLGQVTHIQSEKKVLQMLNFPFVAAFLGSFQDDRRLFFLFEYIHGGDLYGRLRREGRLPVDHAKFYAVELVLTFDYLHSYNIAYRDIKPENIMIDRDGHIKLIDFGFAKVLEADLTYTIVGTPEYIAPEIIQSIGHSIPVDMWSLGILIYEMLAGYPPFVGPNPFEIYKKILGLEIKYPRHMDVKAVDLIRKLLALSPGKRLTCTDCLQHVWFDMVDWMSALKLEIASPWFPRVEKPDDTRLFEVVNERDGPPDSFDASPQMERRKDRLFENF